MSGSAGQIEKLKCILDISRRLAATTDLDELLSMIIDAARQVLDCERATIFLYDPDRHELFSRVATGAESIRFPADRGIAGAAATGRTVINVPDAYADQRFNPQIDHETGFRTRNLLTLPLENLDGDLMGVLQTLNKPAGPFDQTDEDLACVLGAQAGVALHRWRLLEEFAAKQRMARDLELARTIQQAQFPEEAPAVPGYEIAGWNRPADETGGDCYDFVPLPDGRLAIFLADATGHGIAAALIIAQCRALLRAMLSVTTDLPTVVSAVNRLLTDNLTAERFVTAFFGILDPARHRLEYIAAGQGPLLFISPHDLRILPASTFPLAICDALDCQPAAFEFAPASTLLLLTDGFYEAASPAGELCGEQRIGDFARANRDLPPARLIDELRDLVDAFVAAGPQRDDLTAVIVRRLT